MTGEPIVPAGQGDLDALSQVIAGAFLDLPPSRWLVPGAAERRLVFPAYFRLLLDWAMAAGTVTTTGDRSAVALWIPAGGAPPEPPPDYPGRLAAITGTRLPWFRQFDELMEEHHPVGVPHEWLAVIAVSPGRQGRGTGSALLAARHYALDHAGRGAYLEAATPRVRELYMRHGYADRGEPIQLHCGGPQMFPMWRDPRPGTP